MALSFCVLGSGSSGNATYVAGGGAALLIDAGFSCRELLRRLEQAELDVGSIAGLCISHEHQDHTRGAATLSRRFGIPLYANVGTADALRARKGYDGLNWRIFANGSSFAIGDLGVEAFSIPHDAYDPVAFRLRHDGVEMAVASDMGIATGLLRERLSGCHALVLESNHDEVLVQESERPWYIKQRTLGRQGHLSNGKAAELLGEVAGPQLQQVVLVHLSGDCNRSELAHDAARRALDGCGYSGVGLTVSRQDQVTQVFRVGARRECAGL